MNADMTRHYGDPMLSPGVFGRHPRLKNRLLTPVQYRILDLFGWLDRRTRGGPVMARFARRVIGPYLYSLKVEVNSACELKCRLCYIRDPGAALDREVLLRIVRQLKDAGVRLELLGGEPLMREDIVEVIARAKRDSRVPHITLYSNGIRADAQLSRRLRAAGLDAAIISLFSPRSEIHDDVTNVPGSYGWTIAGITRLLEAGVPVYTFTPVTAYNCDDCRPLDELVRRLGARPLFYQYVPQRPDDPLLIDNARWERIKHWVLAERNPGHQDFVRRFFMLTGNACSGGNFVITVKADGSVQPCPFVDDMSLGSIHERGLWEIYRDRFGQAAYREFKSLPRACAGCSHRSVCGGGCRAANRMLFGSYCRPDLRCRGPFRETIRIEAVTDRVPTFF